MTEHVHHDIVHHDSDSSSSAILMVVIILLLALLGFGLVSYAMGWQMLWEQDRNRDGIQFEGDLNLTNPTAPQQGAQY